MQVKTFLGKSTQALLTQIKEELGPDAIILSNRTLRRDGERVYEVTAGVDRTAVPASMAAKLSAGASKSTVQAAYTSKAESAHGHDPDDFGAHLISPSQKVKQMASQWMEEENFASASHGQARQGEGRNAGREHLREHMAASHAASHAGRNNAGRSSMGQSSQEKSRTSPRERSRQSMAPAMEYGSLYDGFGAHPAGWGEWHKEWQQIKDHLFALMKPSIQMEKLTPRHRVALEYLQREGVGDAIILKLYRRLLVAPNDSVLQCLSEIVPVLPWNEETWRQRIHCFTGPFGVGKTTTALRMALQLRASNPLCRIAFINADCQRGNGRLILRHWAELSDFAYTEASDASSMNSALVAHAHADKIFIDLPSLSIGENLIQQYEHLGIEGQDAGSKATHLILAPSFEEAQLMHFLQRYAPHGPGSLIWAKLDETLSYGAMINAAAHCHLPISALSCGPELRETLVSASEPLLWRLIFKRQLPSAAQAQN